MRITQQMSTLSVVNNIQGNNQRKNKAYQMLTTGRKIIMAQDDPSGAVKAMGLRTQATEIEQYKRNANTANAVLTETDSSLQQVTTTLNRIRELTVQGSNSTNDQTSRDAVGDEINQLLEGLIDVANTQVAGRYIFGGYQTKEAPYSYKTGGNDGTTGSETLTTVAGEIRTGINSNNITVVENKGDDGELVTEVSPNVVLPFTVSGQDIFGKNNEMFKTISNLRDSLYKNDTKAIQNSLGDLDDLIDQTLRVQSKVGALSNRVDKVTDRLTNKDYSVTDLLSKTEDVDYAQALIDLNTQSMVHQLSLQVGAKLIQPTLMDFLN